MCIEQSAWDNPFFHHSKVTNRNEKKGGVNIGTLHTTYLSFICAEQTVWVKPYFGDDSNIKKNIKTVAGNIRPPFPLSKCVLYALMF